MSSDATQARTPRSDDDRSEESVTETRRNAAVARPAGDLVRPRTAGGALARPAAVYDTVTDGLTGKQFLLTGRWIAFIGAAVAFAIVCSMLALWQFDRGRQASADNAIVSANFDATPVPLTQALPALGSYGPDQNWQRVRATGTYQADDQLFVRNRFRGSSVGFEVLTPLRTSDGRTLIVDRGWVASSSSDTTVPARKPSPPSGTVSVVVRLRPSEAPRGTGGGAADQIQSVDLTSVKDRVGGSVYTGAYGVLNTQSPPATAALKPVQPTPPAEGVGYHYSYVLQWILFALIGFFVLGRAIRNEFRRLNADDPEEQARAAERARAQAMKPFTDEESEDEILDGYIPLTRWGFGPGSALSPPPRELDTKPARTDVFVLDSGATMQQSEPADQKAADDAEDPPVS